LATAAAALIASAAPSDSPKQMPESTPPEVTGEWTGIWWTHPPAPRAPDAEISCKRRLDCAVTREGNGWRATFEGECSRPYKFAVTMDGRQAGGTVLFKGTSDLGEENGGVYDWIGRATRTEFVGFFTSAHQVGEFRLDRKQ